MFPDRANPGFPDTAVEHSWGVARILRRGRKEFARGQEREVGTPGAGDGEPVP